MIRTTLSLALGMAIGAGGLFAWQTFAPHLAQPYAGQDAQRIASLSPSDIEALRKGEGWGLAKPAELNDHPGPLHVIELAEEIELTGDQRAKVEASFAAMRAAAMEAGEALIEAERALDRGFEAGGLDQPGLRALIARAEAARAKLREVHLAAHLEVAPLLSAEQRERYAALRGYGDGAHHGGH